MSSPFLVFPGSAFSLAVYFSPAGMSLEGPWGFCVLPALFGVYVFSSHLSVLSCVNANKPQFQIIKI